MAVVTTHALNCDRCSKLIALTGLPPEQVEAPGLAMKFNGETYTYNDLCERCVEVIGKLMAKVFLGLSVEEAAAAEVQMDYPLNGEADVQPSP